MTLVFFVAFKIPFLELAQLEMTRMNQTRRSTTFPTSKKWFQTSWNIWFVAKKDSRTKKWRSNEDTVNSIEKERISKDDRNFVDDIEKKTGKKRRKRDVPDLVEHSIHGKQKQKEPQSNSKDVPRRRFIDDEQHSVKSTLLGCKGKKSGQSPPRALEKMVLITGWNKMFQTSWFPC